MNSPRLAKRLAVIAVIAAVLVIACTRVPPPVDRAILEPATTDELQKQLVRHDPDVDLFRARGPFSYAVAANLELRPSLKERVMSDFYVVDSGERAPLVVFLHGYGTSKEAHSRQAQHVASWGMHALSVQLSKRGPWVANGRTLAQIVRSIQRSPEVLGPRVDTSRIILVGHSFGGASVAIALAEGAPAIGGILLDPAAAIKGLPNFLRKVKQPVLIVGADYEVSWARSREHFFQHIPARVAEFSIRNAGHDDGQYPSETALRNNGIDPGVNEEAQITFTAALTAAALSLASTGSMDYAWQSYTVHFDSGRFIDAKRK
jgi:dienelactone hydrolase